MGAISVEIIFKSCCYLGAALVALWLTALPMLKPFANFILPKDKNRTTSFDWRDGKKQFHKPSHIILFQLLRNFNKSIRFTFR